uniref:Sperm acrosome associated 9 n=1 Tax=Pongo abelii TaxID=9601 RepID=A0A8I5TQL8_PONAB
MNEVKESLRSIEQKYKLFQQQQLTFTAALEHCRENAHDKIRPISSIGQVQSYMEHYCNNSTDRRILLMFLDICSELNKLCQHFEAVHSGTPVTNNLLEKCKTLVSQSNDLSSLRAKYPHDVVNHLSCDEARNHYGGVVSLIPLILDLMKEWIAHSEKLPRKVLQHVGFEACTLESEGAADRYTDLSHSTQGSSFLQVGQSHPGEPLSKSIRRRRAALHLTKVLAGPLLCPNPPPACTGLLPPLSAFSEKRFKGRNHFGGKGRN